MNLAIDLYSGNGFVNWTLLRETLVSHVILKCSQGTLVEPGLIERANAVYENGFSLSLYHEYDYRYTAEQNIESCLRATAQLQAPLIFIASEEMRNWKRIAGKLVGLPVPVPSGYEVMLRYFCKVVSESRSIGIYTRKSFFDQYCPGGIYWAWKYPLWVAHYQSVAPAIPLPWADWWGWQFTDRAPGRKYGTPQSTSADLSYLKA